VQLNLTNKNLYRNHVDDYLNCVLNLLEHKQNAISFELLHIIILFEILIVCLYTRYLV